MTAEFMLIVFTILAVGVFLVPMASRLGLGSVLGYLIAGVVIAPVLSWAKVDVAELQHFTEFGVVMMLFLIGLEMQPKLLWGLRTRIFVMGGFQVVTTAILVMGAAMMLEQSWRVSLAIGLVFSLSSTAIVQQTLSEKGLLRSDGGQASFSVLLFQDIAVIPILALIPLLATPALVGSSKIAIDSNSVHGDSSLNLNLLEGLSGWQMGAVILFVICLVILGGRYLTAPIFRHIASTKLRELFVSAALMIVIAIALLMTMIGLSPALGTFVAGVVMANSEYRHELQSNIAPFKGIFLGVFFITVGASIDFTLLMSNFGPIITIVIGLIALKVLVLLILGKVFNLDKGDRWLMSLGLAQAGEFGFVLVSFTVGRAVIPMHIADKLLLVIAISMLLTPLLFILYDRFVAPVYLHRQEREKDNIENHSSIIVAGHGRFGGIINRALRAASFETTIVDYSSEHLELLRRFGFSVYFGDATRPDLLNAAGIDEAKVLVIAIDDKEAITQLASYVRKYHPNVHIVARAIDRWHVYDLYAVGCHNVIRETYASSLQAARCVFEELGLGHERAQKLLAIFEDFDRKSMEELASTYHTKSPLDDKASDRDKVGREVNRRESLLKAEFAAVINEQ